MSGEKNSLMKPKVQINFGNLEKPTHESVEMLISENLEWKMSAYLKKIYSNYADAEIIFDISLSKNLNDETFNGIFHMTYPGMKDTLSYERERFNNLLQLIDHAFQHFKEFLSNQKA